MASPGDIQQVRINTNEFGSDPYPDQLISDKIDALGVAGASASMWEEKAGKYADLADVSEAGASHKFSDLSKNALAMWKHWTDQQVVEVPVAEGHPVVRVIERS